VVGQILDVRKGGAMKTWLNVTEAAEYAGVSRDTIYTAVERGELRHSRLAGRRAIRIRPQWIDEWFERHARCGDGHVSTHTSMQ
jgi:excisionase family DNA binding protein